MKKSRHTPDQSPTLDKGGALWSRRKFLAAAAGLAATPKTLEFLGDAFTISEAERRQYIEKRNQERAQLQAQDAANKEFDHNILRRRFEKEDRQLIVATIGHNQARQIAEVQTDSGIKIDVLQAQTGWNDRIPITVDAAAMNESIKFLFDATSEINEVNGSPIDPGRIYALREKANAGDLDNVHLTVIVSGNGQYHGPTGDVSGMGAFFNGHPHRGDDPRETLLPLIIAASNVYYPYPEVITPTPSVGISPGEQPIGFESTPTSPAESITALFAHEFSHAIMDILGSDLMIDQMDGIHSAPQMEHKTFVTPLNWYHSAALVGRAEGKPKLAPSFIVQELD